MVDGTHELPDLPWDAELVAVGRDAGVAVASIHPMFGPDVRLLAGRHVILVDPKTNRFVLPHTLVVRESTKALT